MMLEPKTRYSIFSLRQKSKKTFRTEYETKEGVFLIPQGDYIARVRYGKSKKYTTISRHKTEAEAKFAYNQYYVTNNKSMSSWEKMIHRSSSMEAKDHQFALFIGRWQELHYGHQSLFQQVLDEGRKVCIAIRDCPVDEKNTKPALKVFKELTTFYAKQIEEGSVEVIVIPDISSVCFGREVGYDIVEYIPPAEIAEISSTKIKEKKNEANNDNTSEQMQTR